MKNIEIIKIPKQRAFYHYAPILLGQGSVIEPGNFGRICKLGSGLNRREEFVETIREDYYPSKPSRLESIFLLPSIDDAYKYRRHQNMLNNQIDWNVLYKVEPLEDITDYHLGCTGIFDKMLARLSKTERDISIAKDYWSGVTAELKYSNGFVESFAKEVVLPMPVKVISKIQI